MRKQFEMTQEDLDKMIAAIDAARNAPLIMIGGTLPRSVQEVANDAWVELGNRMGFKGLTAQPVGPNPRFFSAEVVDLQ